MALVGYFNSAYIPLPELLSDCGVSKNSELPSELLKYLMQGCATCGITGRTGTGKFVLLRSMLGHIDPKITIGVVSKETDFVYDMLYPERNIIHISESLFSSEGYKSFNVCKKDGVALLVNDIGLGALVAPMLKCHRNSCVMTLFTHYADTTDYLIYCLQKELFLVGDAASLDAAEMQVVSFLDFDIHMAQKDGVLRYIERITEVVPDMSNAGKYTTQDIIRYNPAMFTYEVVHPISEERVHRLLSIMDSKTAEEFKQFLSKTFVS